MSNNLSLERIVKELWDFELKVNSYYSDGGYTSFVDSMLSPKVKALRFHLIKEGYIDLVEELDSMKSEDGSALDVLGTLRELILPEIEVRLSVPKDQHPQYLTDIEWSKIHPRIVMVAKPRLEGGQYADSVEAAFKEINERVKKHTLQISGEEIDGTKLMFTAFNPEKPLISLADPSTETGRNIQKGYQHLFAGAMSGIRNPKAHANINLSRDRAIHMLHFASLLAKVLDDEIGSKSGKKNET